MCNWEQPKQDCPVSLVAKGVQCLLEVHQVPSGIVVMCFLLVVIPFHCLIILVIEPLPAHKFQFDCPQNAVLEFELTNLIWQMIDFTECDWSI